MATFNGEKHIKEQIESVLMQLSATDELIISDDGSTDNTLIIIKNFGDNRIKILHHQKPKLVKMAFYYVSSNFENALKNAKGDYIFLCDQDDIWKPKKVHNCLKILQDYDLVLHDCEIVDENMSLIEKSYFEVNKSKKGLLNNLTKNAYLGCCMAFRKSVLQKSIPFPAAEIPHDIWIGLIAEYYFKINFYSENMISYRRHGKNVSPSGEKSMNSVSYKLTYRLIIIHQLIKKLF